MSTIKKIAILRSSDDKFTFEIDDFINFCVKNEIDVKVFNKSEDILPYTPDCVFITSPQHAKLTPFPTYGLINFPRDEYLAWPRYLRNLLTYDAYFTKSPRLKIMLQDLLFGARKLNSPILDFDLYPVIPEIADSKNNTPNIYIFEPMFYQSRNKQAIYNILEKNSNIQIITFSMREVTKHHGRFITLAGSEELGKIIAKNDIIIILESADDHEELIFNAFVEITLRSCIVLTHESKTISRFYEDNIAYFPKDTSLSDIASQLKENINSIMLDYQSWHSKAENAKEISLKNFTLNAHFEKFINAHQVLLYNKGYQSHPDQSLELKLPSVSYIMRTGGKHRPFLERALNCLAAQNYPDLRVIFVTHVEVPFLDDLMKNYPTLKYKILKRIKSKRSEAIRDGMAAVETELFGLFDDDDELYPNHVRSLVSTLHYHSGRDWRGEIGMVYSGSIHADDTYPVFERVEFQDSKLVNRNEKRAIEHFRYYSSALMSKHMWFMPNGWLARTSLIDNELLTDPGLDTCEDLYFELQIAQKKQMAFSVEVTAVHHFHHIGNSTIDDSHKHYPDTQRIALRNFSRTFPTDSLYDTPYNPVGRISHYDPNQFGYQRHIQYENYSESSNPFYPFRYLIGEGAIHEKNFYQSNNMLFSSIKKVSKLINLPYKIFKMDHYKRQYYYDKFFKSISQYGILTTIFRTINFASNVDNFSTQPMSSAKSNQVIKFLFLTSRPIHLIKRVALKLFSKSNIKPAYEELNEK